MRVGRGGVEWPTVGLMIATYLLWGVGTTVAFDLSAVLGIFITGLAITQFSSLQHEALHGHPFRAKWVNEAIMTPALALTVPFGRFRDTHLAHHHDPILTDPFDDPESNFFCPEDWSRKPRVLRWLCEANNTLAGRMLLGPILGNAAWLASEARMALAGAPAIRRDWGLHMLGMVPVVGWLWGAAMPWWAYLLAAWLGHGLLKIRTYLEHRTHESPRARSVIVEDRGPLALLFLNNNYHAVHHSHPRVAWYRLPGLYRENRTHFLRRNDGYHYTSYAAVFARYFLRRKDPLVHPLYRPR